MALEAIHKTKTGAVGKYWKINRATWMCATGSTGAWWEIWLGFYADNDTRTLNSEPLLTYPINFADSDPRAELYGLVKQAMLDKNGPYAEYFADIVAVMDVAEPGNNTDLEALKRAKTFEIDTARLRTNTNSFPYKEKFIACDALSRSDIDGVNGCITLTGEFPDGWLGGWKAMDKSIVPIATIEQWKEFYGAMVAQGQKNFVYSQGLKQLLGTATTVDQVQAIAWGIDLGTFQLPQPIEVTNEVS
jgi:hypothetical protein